MSEPKPWNSWGERFAKRRAEIETFRATDPAMACCLAVLESDRPSLGHSELCEWLSLASACAMDAVPEVEPVKVNPKQRRFIEPKPVPPK